MNTKRPSNDQSRKKANASSYLGQSIRELRSSMGLSQACLADLLGVSPQAVSKWERGGALPDIDLLIPLAEIFSVSLDKLFKRSENDY